MTHDPRCREAARQCCDQLRKEVDGILMLPPVTEERITAILTRIFAPPSATDRHRAIAREIYDQLRPDWNRTSAELWLEELLARHEQPEQESELRVLLLRGIKVADYAVSCLHAIGYTSKTSDMCDQLVTFAVAALAALTPKEPTP